MDDLVKVLAFVGIGLAIGQIYVHFALRELWKDHNGDDNNAVLRGATTGASRLKTLLVCEFRENENGKISRN